MKQKTIMVGNDEIPLPVFSIHEVNSFNIDTWGFDAVLRKHPVNPNLPHYKEKMASWRRYVQERCILEPYYHGYVQYYNNTM